VPLRAALLAGSAGRGDADDWSDVDLILYVDGLPAEELVREVAVAAGAGRLEPKELPPEQAVGVEGSVGGVRVEIVVLRVSFIEAELERLLAGEAVGSPLQKVLGGMADGLPLRDDGVLAGWRRRIAAYPEPLRGAMVEHHWRFFPLWYYAEQIAARDAELWRLDILLDAAFDLLGVLAGLNRVWFTRFELKRTRAFVRKLELAPPQLVDRLESLFTLPPPAAAEELARLVAETRELVAAELPELDLPLRRPLGERQQRSTLPAER
jgi:predicted nucleotidyltransferase